MPLRQKPCVIQRKSKEWPRKPCEQTKCSWFREKPARKCHRQNVAGFVRNRPVSVISAQPVSHEISYVIGWAVGATPWE
jgi:hypothetical protein